jgi:polysaccharide pyruvyl transferase WcaK-like protein
LSKHVSIIGSAFSGNKGASAMLEASIQAILDEYPDATFTLFSMYPSEDRLQNPFSQLEVIDAQPKQLGVTINTLSLLYKIFPFLRSTLRKNSKAIAALTRSDVLLDQMGISFTDGREKFLLYNTAALLPALLLKTPVIKCSQAIGPFKNPINRFVSKAFLPKIEKIITRGRITHGFAKDLGLNNITESSDSAFTLRSSGNERQSVSRKLDLSFFEKGNMVIGVLPSVVVQKKFEAKTGQNYIQLMANYINVLAASGRRVALIPHSVRSGTSKTHNNDLPLCKEIYSMIENKTDLLFVEQELSSQELRFLIGLCDYSVTSRFHAMISSLSVGVPCLVIGWSHKYQEVLERFGLESWAIGFENLSADLLHEKTEQLVNEGLHVRGQIRDKLPLVIKLAREQEKAVSSLLARPTRRN